MSHASVQQELTLGFDGIREYGNSRRDDTFTSCDWPWGTHDYEDNFRLSLNSNGSFELYHEYLYMNNDNDPQYVCYKKGNKVSTGSYRVLGLNEDFAVQREQGKTVNASKIELKFKHFKEVAEDFLNRRGVQETSGDLDQCCEAMVTSGASPAESRVWFQSKNMTTYPWFCTPEHDGDNWASELPLYYVYQ